MHPVSDTLFGPDGIAVKFNNGTSVTSGYIVKQLGTSRYKVTDGSLIVTCVLATTLDEAEALPPGAMTILIGSEHVMDLTATKASTIEGNLYPWSLNTSVDGAPIIQSAAAVAASTSST